MPQVKFDEKTVLDLPRPTKAGARIWYKDASTPGFGIVARPDSVSYFVDFRDGEGKLRRLMLGAVGSVSLKDARKAAKVHLGTVALGGNPLEAKREARRAQQAETFTLGQLWEQYQAARKGHWKTSGLTSTNRTAETYEGLWRLLIAPTFEHVAVARITREQVERWHRAESKERPVRANRALTLLKSVLGWGVDRGHLPSNPAARVEKNREKARETFLSPEGVDRLLVAIDAEAALFGKKAVAREGTPAPGRGGRGMKETESRGISPHTAALFKLLLFSGARLNEICRCRWAWVHLDAQVIRLPDAKKGARTIHLGAEALAVVEHLARIRTPGHPFLIEGSVPGNPLVNPQKPWDRVRTTAGLKSLRLHDLRHSYVSAAIQAGVPLMVVGSLAGHRDKRSVMRYTHIHDSAAQAAAQGFTIQRKPTTAPPAAPAPVEQGTPAEPPPAPATAPKKPGRPRKPPAAG